MANLTESQKQRIFNIQAINYSIGLIGFIGGIVYAKKTGGGFWRYVGWSFAGSVATGLIGSLATTPFTNKILKESELNPSATDASKETRERTTNIVETNLSQQKTSIPTTQTIGGYKI